MFYIVETYCETRFFKNVDGHCISIKTSDKNVSISSDIPIEVLSNIIDEQEGPPS